MSFSVGRGILSPVATIRRSDMKGIGKPRRPVNSIPANVPRTPMPKAGTVGGMPMRTQRNRAPKAKK